MNSTQLYVLLRDYLPWILYTVGSVTLVLVLLFEISFTAAIVVCSIFLLFAALFSAIGRSRW